MKVLDYYDERMVAKACPVSWRMLLGVAAGSCMAAIIWGIVYNGKSLSEIPIVSIILLAVCLISFSVCLWFGLINTDTTPRSDVQENLKEYWRLRLVNETTNVKWKNYLFIIDNTDGHKMLAKELNAFLVKDKSKNRSRSASRKGASK